MYLVGTNVWLERLLDQEQSESVGKFLAQAPPATLLLTDFTLHSVGIALTRLEAKEAFIRFVQDVVIDGGVQIATVHPRQVQRLIDVMDAFKLDFDDAYQYVAAENHHATMVSLDSDFDRTDRGRRTPAELLEPPSSTS